MSGREILSAERLKALTAAYGADPARWPAAERKAALGLAETDPGARRALDDAGRIDRLLDAAAAPPLPSASLTGRVLETAPRPAGARLRLVFGAVWRPVTGLAVAAMLGVMVGALAPVSVSSIATDTGTDTEITGLFTNASLDLDAPGETSQ